METIEQPSCKELYEQSNGAKVLLMSMVIGLRSEGGKRNLGDMTLEPYASSTQKSNFSPKKNDLVNEIDRRYATNPNSFPKKSRPVNWTKTLLMECLTEHPITLNEDITYLREEEQKFIDMLHEAACQV